MGMDLLWICFGFAISWCSISMLGTYGTWTLVCNMCFFQLLSVLVFRPNMLRFLSNAKSLDVLDVGRIQNLSRTWPNEARCCFQEFPGFPGHGSTQLKESATTLTKRILHTACNPSSSCMSSKSSSNGSIEAVLRRSTACCTPFSGNASTKTTSNRLLWMFLFAHQVLSQSPD